MKGKINLSLEVDLKDLDDDGHPTKQELEEYLKDSLFEICEDWVIRGQEPDLDVKVE